MAFSYNKKNLANTTIAGAITSSDTSITVDDATVFPSGYFYATLMPGYEMSTFSNSEIVLVTNISSNTLTIARGQKSTTARAFSAGAIITNGVYTEDLDFAQSVGKKIFSAVWGGQASPYYKITDDMLKVVPDEGTSIRVIFDTDYSSGTANLSINETSSGIATASGSSISIADAANLAPLDVKLRGDTFRQIYSGKNLLNDFVSPTGDNLSTAGITYTIANDGTIATSGTSSLGHRNVYWRIRLPAGTYKFSGCPAGGSVSGYSFCIEVDGQGSFYYDTGEGETFTLSQEAIINAYAIRLGGDTGINMNGKVFKPMITVSTASQDFEPYVGGIASPNPNYPQTVKVVTGEQTVTISDGNSNTQTFNIQLSKNLYYSTLQRGYLDEDTGALLTNTTSRMVSDFVSVRPNSTYTLSAKTGVSGRTVQASVYYYTNNNFISYANWSSVAKTFTTPANATQIRIVFRLDNSAECTSASFYDIQVEKGSSATAYSSFVCLSKLTNSSGNAQDYIYKSGSDWYIHKETSYIVCNGSETWTNAFSNVGRKDIALANVNYSNLWLVLSDNYLTNVSLDDGSIFLSSSAGGVSIIDTTNGTNVTNWVNYLSIHNISILYPLATPTNTKITDATLISQLNALANATLYAGTNNIVVTGGLSGILEVQYFRSGSSVNPVPIVNGAYVADDNTRNIAPVKAGIPYDLTYHSGNWYVMNMVKKITSDDIDFATYATTEQVVGTWTNGKPIYRRVININSPSKTNTDYVNLGNDFQDLISLSGVMVSSTGYRVPIPQTDSSSTYAVLLVTTSNTIRGRFSFADTLPTSVYVIIEYTKTTDQQTRSVPDDETNDKKSGEIEPEEPVEEPQEK